ncbi:MAG: HEAT repeat domain-containing protein [Pseudomonadota bacterium]|nr:HEAT repeat domain-containing protein [Pseudomonadota bacterium]
MEPAVDPFHPLLRLLERYRNDVHYLRPPAGEQAIPEVQKHLPGEIPASLLHFLTRWNGATLFRGALRVRGVADLAPPRPDVPEVILFADGPRDDDRWGYAAVPDGHHFGRWDGERLVAQHEHFNRWLLAQARVLDEDRRDEGGQLQLRLEVDPENGLLYFLLGEQLLAEGDGDAALKAFRRATALAPETAAAWQRLGEALLSVDRAQATGALLMSLRHTSLPLAYPGAPVADAGIIRSLEHQFPAGDAGWERELHHFLTERCHDIRHADGAELFEAACLAMVRVHLSRGDRSGARDALQALRDRAATYSRVPELPNLHLTLVALDTELGHHDEAEDSLRRLRRHPDAQVRARGELALARIALLREEPWAEDIARDALLVLKSPADRADAWLLLAEKRDAAALDEAARLVTLLGDPVRGARVSLLRGDACRDAGDLPAAYQHYLACGVDPESHLRAEVRIGDLAGDPADALPHYATAVSGYQELQLPLREAWARLRLVRCGDPSQAEQAQRLFKTAGLAAGVAAADTLVGRTGHSLTWHLNLAAELARQRHDAQRLRPPLARADADRPERRLMSHRRAIAGCDSRIVPILAEDILTELRRLQQSDGRARDPAAMRFVAGVDLLAGHPSWDAAQVLMNLLREDVQPDVAARALLGALARSPNMVLVEQLLSALRTLSEPRAVASVAEVLGWRREPEAAPRLRELAVSGSLPVRRAAITALGRIGDLDAIDLICPALDEPDLAEAASIALLVLGEWRGVDFHGQALASGTTGLSRSPGEIVGRHGGPSYLLLLLSVADREGPEALGAIQGLGLLGSVRAVPRLIELVGTRDTMKQAAAAAALEVLTGHRIDLEDAHPRQRWDAWWSQNRGTLPDSQRWRGGHPLTVRALIDRLGNDDPQVRQTSYDELVITTGAPLPFDADGPWRMQLAHRAAWSRWYADHAHELPQTGWLFHGDGVG